MEESSTLHAANLVKERKEDGLPVYNFGLGANPLPKPQILEKELKDKSWDSEYGSIEGTPELRDALIDKYTSENYKPVNTLVGHGLKELLFATQIAFDGILVIVDPYWLSYRDQADILNNYYWMYHTEPENDFKIIPSEFEEFVEKIQREKKQADKELSFLSLLGSISSQMMIIFNNPSNPSGTVYSTEEVKELAKVFKRHDILVLADEIYIDLVHNGHETTSIAEFYPEGTIVGNSLSKQFACGGYRLGWMIFPEEQTEFYGKIKSIASNMYSCASVPIQHVATRALTTNFDDYMKNTVNIFTRLGRMVYNFLTKKTKLMCSTPMGGWYMLVNFYRYTEKLKEQGIEDDRELANRLIEDIGFVTVAGSNFIPVVSLNDKWRYIVRISYIDISEKDTKGTHITKGLNKLLKWIKEL